MCAGERANITKARGRCFGERSAAPWAKVRGMGQNRDATLGCHAVWALSGWMLRRALIGGHGPARGLLERIDGQRSLYASASAPASVALCHSPRPRRVAAVGACDLDVARVRPMPVHVEGVGGFIAGRVQPLLLLPVYHGPVRRLLGGLPRPAIGGFFAPPSCPGFEFPPTLPSGVAGC